MPDPGETADQCETQGGERQSIGVAEITEFYSGCTIDGVGLGSFQEGDGVSRWTSKDAKPGRNTKGRNLRRLKKLG